MGEKITLPDTTDPTSSDWQNFIAWVEDVQIGKINMSFSEMYTTSEPKIQAGSRVEVDGVLYWFSSEEAATGWSGISNSTQAYMVIVPDGNDITAEWTDTTPTWSDAKQGWYLSGTSKRAVLRCYKDASGNYIVKEYYEIRYDSADDVEGDLMIIEDAFSIFESDYLNFFPSLYKGIEITPNDGEAPTYIGNGEIVYRSGDNLSLYKKSVDDSSNGTRITSVNSENPCYIGNGEIVYKNYNASQQLYKKSIDDDSEGNSIVSVASINPCYIGNDEIVYENEDDGDSLYRKSVNNTSTGTKITSVSSGYPCYIGNGEIVYRNNDDADGGLYRKSVNDSNTGTKITSVSSTTPCYIGNGEIVYRNSDDADRGLYRKSVNDTSTGTKITSVSSFFPCYIGDGYIVYTNSTDGELYKMPVRKGLLF